MKRLLILAIFLMLAASAFLSATGKQEATAVATAIKWDKPVPWPERLLADKYVLPEGWQKATEGVKEITFYNSGGLSTDIATAMNMARFEQLTGIKVNAIAVSADLAEPKSLATLVAKDTSVDAVLANDPAYNLSSLVAGGWIVPIDVMFPPEVTKLYNPDLKSSYMWDGHWYCAAVTYIGHIDFYRPSWLKKTGLALPDNYVDLYEVIKKVDAWAKQTNGPDNYGAVFVGSTQDALNWYRTLMYSQGSKVIKDGKYQFGSPESKKAFALMVDVVKNGYAPRDVLTYAWGDAGLFFGTGKAGFLFAIQPSYITVYQRGDYEKTLGGDVDVFAPLKWDKASPDSLRGKGVVGSNSMLINKYINNNQKAAVMLFYDYIRSLEGQRNEVIVEGNESGLTYLWENMAQQLGKVDWAFADKVADSLKIDHVQRRTSLPALQARKVNSLETVFEVYLPGFQQISQKFIEEFSKAVLGEHSIDEAIKNIQAIADELS
jgi:ABC-type glycerol-3-phosphate transport system substrate-binding protein